MLTLQMSKTRKYLFISCHPSYAHRIHELPYPVQFSYERKCWITPAENLSALQESFRGEIYYKTPKWFIDGLDCEPVAEDHFYRDPVELPVFCVKPYDYQVKGAQMMVDRIRQFGFCLNSDGVGSGKSFQALMTAGYYIRQKCADRILIICKKSIKYQWAREIDRFTDWKHEIFITGDTKKKRLAAYEGASSAKKSILIANYHNFLHDFSQINAVPWDVVILDEAHSVKKHGTKMNSLIGYTMRGKRCIFLTATPVLTTPEDLYGIISMASLPFFGSYSEFEKEYLVIEYGKFGRQVIGAKHLDELTAMVSGFMIRRSEKQINVELPQVRNEPIRTPMDDVQRTLVAHIEEKLAAIESGVEKVMDGNDIRDPEVLAQVEAINEQRKMYLAAKQFAADDPRIILDLEDGYVSRPLKELVPEKYKGSLKTEATIDTVESIVSAGGKVIVFCHYSTSARLLKREIEEKLGVNVCIYTGDETTEQREACITAFRDTPEWNVLVGTDSMAEGLNLQVSNFQIHYEQAQTYAMRTQRIGRSRRIGSDGSQILIYDMITEDSFDEDRINKIARDKEVTGAILDNAG